MSRIGIRPIKIEEGVDVNITADKVVASFGDKQAELFVPLYLDVKITDGSIYVTRKENTKEAKSAHGLTARLIANLITGVKTGFKKELIFKGTGYRAAIDGNNLLLNMGYSHEIKLEIPEGLKVAVVKNSINVEGQDKQLVGEFSASVREVRGPEVYKGKGIRYSTETIKRKAGKKAAK